MLASASFGTLAWVVIWRRSAQLSMARPWSCSDGRYKMSGHLGSACSYVIGLCCFELGKFDPHLLQPLRLPDDNPLTKSLSVSAGRTSA